MLISSGFFLQFLEEVQKYLSAKYKLNEYTNFNSDKSLDILISELQKQIDGKIDPDDKEWINENVLTSVLAIAKTISSKNLESVSDLAALSNAGNKKLHTLRRLIASNGENYKEHLSQILNSYLTYLVESKFVSEFEYKTAKMKPYMEAWKIEDFGKYKVVGKLQIVEMENLDHRPVDHVEFEEIKGEIYGSI